MAFETKQCSGRRREVLGEKARRRKSVERVREGEKGSERGERSPRSARPKTV